jgi:hypothetical protein
LRQVEIPDALDRPAAVVEHGDPFDTPPVVRTEPTTVLDDGAEWSDVIRAAEDELDGFNDRGWSVSDLMSAILGFGNLPVVTATPKRTEAGERRARVRKALNRMIASGEIERVSAAAFRWPLDE